MKNNLINKLIDRENLTQKESENLIQDMIEGVLNPVQMSGILTALRMKGETIDEIVGFINVLKKAMLKVDKSGVVIDTCGTGGDNSGTFNISSAVSIVVAGAGVKVAKHGNRSASSLCGSADLMESLGVNINLNPVQASQILKKIGLVFLFAPAFHPAFKNIMPVRKALGIRTVFNFLGPFLNPASVKRQIIGVPNPDIAKKLAGVAQKLNYEHLIIVSSNDGLDEISIAECSQIFEIKKNKIKFYSIKSKDFGIKSASITALKGGDPMTNASIVKEILKGKKGPQRDVVVINSAFALYVAGLVKEINEGIKIAEESIDKGYAAKVLEKLIIESNKYAKHT